MIWAGPGQPERRESGRTWSALTIGPGCWVEFDDMCRLFGLSKSGLIKILDGDVWRPEYQAHRAPRKRKPRVKVPRTYLRPDGTQMVEIAPEAYVSRAAAERMGIISATGQS